MSDPNRGSLGAPFLSSLLLHLAIGAALIALTRHPDPNTRSTPFPLPVWIETVAATRRAMPTTAHARVGLGKSASQAAHTRFIPGAGHFLITGSGVPTSSTAALGSGTDRNESQFGESTATSGEMLQTQSRVWNAFDALARRVHGQLDYNDMLIENGVQGTATLDLYFTDTGEVDEARSATTGSSRILRGLIARASYKGLVGWLREEASRLHRDEFRNQHFRAEFILSGVLDSKSDLARTTPGNYLFTRRAFQNRSCLTPMGAGVGIDVACVALSIGGAVKRSTSDGYQQKYLFLQDQLSDWDERGLRGVNDAARAI